MVGLKIQEIRESKGLSRDELAEKASELAGRPIPRVTVWRIETGESDPKASTLEALAGAMGVSAGLFFDEKVTSTEQQEGIA